MVAASSRHGTAAARVLLLGLALLLGLTASGPRAAGGQPGGEGAVWTWGLNATGELGDGTTALHRATPLPVEGLPPTVAIAAAGDHTLAVAADGRVWSWGQNTLGQLGNGGTADTTRPGLVAELTDARAVAASALWSLALGADGTVWAWGDNRSGQLGQGTSGEGANPRPRRVAGLAAVVAIAAGAQHGLAVTADGRVWAWGQNTLGQLGLGAPSAPRTTPAPVPGLADVVGVAAGISHSLAWQRDGTLWAWGQNSFGQLGTGTTADAAAPVRVRDLAAVAGAAAGGMHSLAVLRDGAAWAWGANQQGQLGNGAATDVPLPQPLPVAVRGLSGATAVAAGVAHSLALDADGRVWTWGSNGAGQLGVPIETAYRAEPAALASPRGAWAIAAGDAHSVVAAAVPAARQAVGRSSETISPAPGHPVQGWRWASGAMGSVEPRGGGRGQLARRGPNVALAKIGRRSIDGPEWSL
jgi:alpha-tubulin suppressor-like RCC1 family protein